MNVNETDNKLGILIGGLQSLATLSDDEVIEYLQSSSGLRSFIESAAGYRSPYVLIVDDHRIHASGPKLIDELFDELLLENKLQAANELRNRLMSLYMDLRSIDQSVNSNAQDERLSDSVANAITDAKQVALEIALFTMKLRKALLTPPLDLIEMEVTGPLFRLYQILKHRRGIWSEYTDLSDTLGVNQETIERYLRNLDTAILSHGKTVDRPRGEKKCRLESISDASIRK